jgi:hypothetical protein
MTRFQPAHYGVWYGSDLQGHHFSRGVSADEEIWLLERLLYELLPVGAHRALLDVLEKHAFAVPTAFTRLSTVLSILSVYIHCLSLIRLVRDYHSIIWACKLNEQPWLRGGTLLAALCCCRR